MLIRPPFPLRNSDDPGSIPNPNPPTQTAQQINAPQIGESVAIAPPPLARVVVTGTKTEGEIALEKHNAELARLLTETQTRAANVEKQFQDYKTAVEAPKPTPKAKRIGVGWFEEED